MHVFILRTFENGNFSKVCHFIYGWSFYYYLNIQTILNFVWHLVFTTIDCRLLFHNCLRNKLSLCAVELCDTGKYHMQTIYIYIIRCVLYSTTIHNINRLTFVYFFLSLIVNGKKWTFCRSFSCIVFIAFENDWRYGVVWKYFGILAKTQWTRFYN